MSSSSLLSAGRQESTIKIGNSPPSPFSKEGWRDFIGHFQWKFIWENLGKSGRSLPGHKRWNPAEIGEFQKKKSFNA
jgi:hypothetical protein